MAVPTRSSNSKLQNTKESEEKRHSTSTLLDPTRLLCSPPFYSLLCSTLLLAPLLYSSLLCSTVLFSTLRLYATRLFSTLLDSALTDSTSLVPEAVQAVYMCIYIYIYIYKKEREKERKREREKERKREKEKERKRERQKERKREREKDRKRERQKEKERKMSLLQTKVDPLALVCEYVSESIAWPRNISKLRLWYTAASWAREHSWQPVRRHADIGSPWTSPKVMWVKRFAWWAMLS